MSVKFYAIRLKDSLQSRLYIDLDEAKRDAMDMLLSRPGQKRTEVVEIKPGVIGDVGTVLYAFVRTKPGGPITERVGIPATKTKRCYYCGAKTEISLGIPTIYHLPHCRPAQNWDKETKTYQIEREIPGIKHGGSIAF